MPGRRNTLAREAPVRGGVFRALLAVVVLPKPIGLGAK